MTSSRWRKVWDQRREIGVTSALLFMLFSGLCYALLPGEMADSNYLFERMSVFVFFGIIMLGSLLHAARLQNAKIAIIIVMALFHFGLWADYMRDFRRDSADFTPGLFAGVGSNRLLGGLMAQDTFRGWEVYRHFPNYFIVWNQGIATTRLVDYPLTYIERKVSREVLPAYSEWTTKWGRYDGRYNGLDYLLLRGDLPPADQPQLVNFKSVAQSGKWTVLTKGE
jgi:hypothetical protein